MQKVRNLMKNMLESNPAAFGSYSSSGELDLISFQQLVELIVPSMGKQESKALFMSMDASRDGSIQQTEIFSEVTLSILANRMQVVALHPLEGSYHCLPSPPFRPDPKQLWAIDILKVVFDEVVIAGSKPAPS